MSTLSREQEKIPKDSPSATMSPKLAPQATQVLQPHSPNNPPRNSAPPSISSLILQPNSSISQQSLVINPNSKPALNPPQPFFNPPQPVAPQVGILFLGIVTHYNITSLLGQKYDKPLPYMKRCSNWK